MAYDFKTFDERIDDIKDWLQKELSTIRTGRATPTLLDNIQVESYGARVPITQVGTIGVEDPRTLRISTWDKGQVKSIEKAITEADLGLSVVTDEQGLRVIFPELTGERREQLVKLAKTKLEEARVSVRSARDEANKKLESADLSDDEKKRSKDDLQKRVDAVNESLAAHYEDKEKEIKQ